MSILCYTPDSTRMAMPMIMTTQILYNRPLVGCHVRPPTKYNPYMPEAVVAQGLRDGKLLKAKFHINVNNSYQAYATINNGGTSTADQILINGIRAQNRAIDGDTVVVLVEISNATQRSGRVVNILSNSPRRSRVVGYLAVQQWLRNCKGNLCPQHIPLIPVDHTFPTMRVSVRTLSPNTQERLIIGRDLTLQDDLVAAELTNWSPNTDFPDALVIRSFGSKSDRESQIGALLFGNGINQSTFSTEALSCIPSIPWEVPDEEIRSRTDLRKLCVFTIDPPTATDLDDALSIEALPNDTFRVGVHITDVSHFVLPDSALDIEARLRSVSVYLLSVHKKFPMLPERLTDCIASLHPGKDRLAFTIFWEVNSQGKILNHSIGRSVIRSCTKLSYQQAQQMINGSFDKDRPQLHGTFHWNEVIDSVKKLHQLSTVLRMEKLPSDRRMDSEILVETYMVLANTTAAEAINAAFPESPLLEKNSPTPSLHTQFTSPLRRYLDIAVHRMLAQSIGIDDPSSTSTKNLHEIVAYCNGKKQVVTSIEKTIQHLNKPWNHSSKK